MNEVISIRMGELVRRSGFPASAVQYYLKQGLLPEPQRPTANSALYDMRHLEALEALKVIKQLGPELPLIQIRRVLELIRQGVEPEVALSLHRAVAGGLPAMPEAGPMTRSELAQAAGTTQAIVEQLIERRILVPAPGSESFDAADLEVLKVFCFVDAMLPGAIEIAAKIAELLRQASVLEMELRNQATAGQGAAQSAEISRQMQNAGNFWHAYLFARLRLHDITKHGLGNVDDPARESEE